MDQTKINTKLMEKLFDLLLPFPEAGAFALAYRDYIHAIDDLIDDENRPSPEALLKVFAQAGELFSMPFWLKYGAFLAILEQIINNTYADSVEWEKMPGDHISYHWKKSDSSVLRHAGIDMFFAILYLTVGRDKLREVSSSFREQAHLMHMDECFKAI